MHGFSTRAQGVHYTPFIGFNGLCVEVNICPGAVNNEHSGSWPGTWDVLGTKAISDSAAPSTRSVFVNRPEAAMNRALKKLRK